MKQQKGKNAPWIAATAAASSVLLFSYYAYRTAFYHSARKAKRVRKHENDKEPYRSLKEKISGWIDELSQVPYESVEICADDGLKLYGRYYHTRDGAPLQIEFHGYRSTAIRDFCGGDPLARRKGFNTLLVDQRAHGNSEGHTITFGVKERYDVLRWAEYACNRFGKDVKIFLVGISMGAASVLMASALPLPENVVGIIADSPYSSPKAIIRKVCKDMKLPPRLTYPFIVLGARLYGGFSLSGSALDAVKHSELPILIVHGESDGFVPMEMSEEIARAGKSTTLLTIPGADHCLGYVTNPETYERVLDGFISDCLNS